MNMKSAYRIGTVWDIPIKIHISLFLLLAYISLRALLFALRQGNLLVALVQVTAVLLMQGFIFASIALHELGHSFVAIRKGCKVREITLIFIGGAAVMENIPRKPRDEILMAAAGPLVSASLALFFGLAYWLLSSFESHLMEWVQTFLLFTALANTLLAVFNLIPAYPMDGGRILRACLTPRFGRLRATRIAATAGRVLALALGAIAMVGIPRVFPPLNFPLLFLAGFVYFVGNREYRQVQIETLMQERGFPNPFGNDPDDDPEPIDDHTVLISPPPYRDGPADRAPIERESRNFFRR